VPQVVEKAIGSAGGMHVSTRRRAAAMGKALRMHLCRLREEPGCYGPMGLSEVFELREDTLREFRFYDIHACGPTSRGPTCSPCPFVSRGPSCPVPLSTRASLSVRTPSMPRPLAMSRLHVSMRWLVFHLSDLLLSAHLVRCC
jgi:hypothetical protein